MQYEPQTRLYCETDLQTAKVFGDILIDALEEDALPVAYFEDEDRPDSWVVSVYAPASAATELKSRLETTLQTQGHDADFQMEVLADVDWVSETLKDLVPVRAGRFVVHGSHDLHVPKTHELGILIDAGQAFGTGHHGTTAGCLELLATAMKRQRYRKVLDLGTGSGVLAIGAAKLQPVSVFATDIDPIAVEVARFNVDINQKASQIRCQTAIGLRHRSFAEQGPFDLILANILARPLEKMAPEICRNLAPGGSIIVSGILRHQKARVQGAFRLKGKKLVRSMVMDDWVTLLMA